MSVLRFFASSSLRFPCEESLLSATNDPANNHCDKAGFRPAHRASGVRSMPLPNAFNESLHKHVRSQTGQPIHSRFYFLLCTMT